MLEVRVGLWGLRRRTRIKRVSNARRCALMCTLALHGTRPDLAYARGASTLPRPFAPDAGINGRARLCLLLPVRKSGDGYQIHSGGRSVAWYRRCILGSASIHFGMDSVLARRSAVLGFAEAEIDCPVFVRVRDRRTIRGGQGGDLPPKIRTRARTIAPGETYRAVD